MTSSEFIKLIAKLESKGVRVTKFRGLNDVLPRLVWQEGRIEQVYASNKACEQQTIIVAEYMTNSGEDPVVGIIIDRFRDAQLPFVCEIGYDEEKDIISYLFNLSLTEMV